MSRENEEIYEEDEELYQTQAHISCISFPTSLDELLMIANDDGRFNLEQILEADYDNSEYIWTVPKWARDDDVVLFYHTKSANVYISQLNSELKKTTLYSDEDREKIMQMISKGKRLHKEYGGMIFAVGRLYCDPFYDDEEYNEYDHFKSRVFSSIRDVCVFKNPVHITEVDSYIKIEQRSTTPLFGEAYDRLVDLLLERNDDLPEYLVDAESVEPIYYGIGKGNWLQMNNDNGRRHQYETQFRTFYVDYLLKELSDDGAIFVECECFKNVRQPSYVDNVIPFKGKYLPVEVKLNIDNESDLVGQVSKYCNTKRMILVRDFLPDKSLIYNNHTMIIDTKAIYLYDDTCRTIVKMIDLDCFRSVKDIHRFKQAITIEQ